MCDTVICVIGLVAAMNLGLYMQVLGVGHTVCCTQTTFWVDPIPFPGIVDLFACLEESASVWWCKRKVSSEHISFRTRLAFSVPTELRHTVHACAQPYPGGVMELNSNFDKGSKSNKMV